IALAPNDYRAYINLATAYQQQRNWTEARAQLDLAIRKNSSVAALHRERAQIHLKESNPAAALDDVNRAIALEPETPARAADLVQKARLLYGAGKFADALEACNAALKIQPQRAEAHLHRAEALVMLKQYREALAALNQYERFGRLS